MLRLLRLARPEAKLLAVSMAAVGVSVASGLALPKGMGLLIDVISNPASQPDLTISTIALSLSGVFVLGAAAMMVRTSVLTVAAERLVLRLRRDLFGTIIRQPLAFFDRNRFGVILKLSEGVNSLMGCYSPRLYPT
eukprot:TRINITY_DN6472_c0_g2_i1.p2 TRINITY_DN6472_c0_g2~~TRINITY_DN6472_c0_g2_i1.p2  ORF type:complete len:136 (+),score=20.85 TRINITY_DN6472_c0_g2_i1:115-522(+)